MSSLIVATAQFESHWPLVVDTWLHRWEQEDETCLIRLERGDSRVLGDVVVDGKGVTRLATLGTSVTEACIVKFPDLREATFQTAYGSTVLPSGGRSKLAEAGVQVYEHQSEGFWGESVAEFALGLTICALRRIPQSYHAMLTSHEPWRAYSAERNQGPGRIGAQFSDDSRFVNGTIAGKRVRIVGAGNIGSRYASFVRMMGADVAAWDLFAPEPNFHRAGSRRVWRLEDLLLDADIFAPMLPLTEQTRGRVTAEHINRLPAGALVVLATRAAICDTEALRQRVLADELALAADVFDIEPLPLDDALLGRHNVVHTPHIAGRTGDANEAWVDHLLVQFESTRSSA